MQQKKRVAHRYLCVSGCFVLHFVSSALVRRYCCVQRAILESRTDANLITALELVKGEDEWEEQPDLYDW